MSETARPVLPETSVDRVRRLIGSTNALLDDATPDDVKVALSYLAAAQEILQTRWRSEAYPPEPEIGATVRFHVRPHGAGLRSYVALRGDDGWSLTGHNGNSRSWQAIIDLIRSARWHSGVVLLKADRSIEIG